MSIIQTIRDKGAAIVIGVIALSLIGFLLMDAKPGQGGIFGGGNSTVIGVVNGKDINLDEYNAKVKEAEAYPVLKVKVGLTTDEATIEAVRSATKKPLRVDANEGWKDKDEAVRKINWLETQGVEFIEQPMPAHMLEDMNYIRKRVHMPIIADEACLHPQDIPKLANFFDGVNIKLDKCGGILEGYRMIQIAKALGLKTMLGCMISSSAAVTAAAHLSPLVDYADLDGNLLISNEPYRGVLVVKGKLVLPPGPGLGLKKV